MKDERTRIHSRQINDKLDYLLVTNFVPKRNFFHIALRISVSTHKSGAHVAKGCLYSLDRCIPHSKWLFLLTVQKHIMSQRTISTLKSRIHHVVSGHLFASQGHILPLVWKNVTQEHVSPLQCLQNCYL